MPEKGYEGHVTAEVKIKDLPFELSEDEMKMLDENPSIPSAENKTAPAVEVKQVEKNFSLAELLLMGKAEEAKYNYKTTIQIYTKALECTQDEDYQANLPLIYTKIAFSSQKLSQWDKSQEYYEKAQEIYENEQEFVKANYIKLSIANLFYETFKLIKAKTLLIELVNDEVNPPLLKTKSYIALANLEDSISHVEEAYKYYEKALKFSNDTMDTDTLAELYFKFALIADDEGKISVAAKYYHKCIELDENPKVNKYLSSAYSNLATMYLEKNENSNALKSFMKAFEIDESLNNLDGMYFSAGKLAQILEKKYPDKALDYYKKAYGCAQEMNDIFYMASSALAIGDFYYNKKKDEVALSQYLYVLDLVQNEFSRDNLDKINMRINDIKFRIGVDKFEELEKEIRNG